MVGIAGYLGERDNKIANEVYEVVKRLNQRDYEAIGDVSYSFTRTIIASIFSSEDRSLIEKDIKSMPQPSLSNKASLALFEDFSNSPEEPNSLLNLFLENGEKAFQELMKFTFLLINAEKLEFIAFRNLKQLGMRKIAGAYIFGSKPKLWNAKLFKPLSGIRIRLEGSKFIEEGIRRGVINECLPMSSSNPS
jgi:hypothetical protein